MPDNDRMLRELYNEMIGSPGKVGFFEDMRSFKRDTEQELVKLHNRVDHIKEDTEPVVEFYRSWKFVIGFIIGASSFVGTLFYLATFLFNK